MFASTPTATPQLGTLGGTAARRRLLLTAVLRVLRRPVLLDGAMAWCAATPLLAWGASVLGVALVRAGTGWGPLDPKYLHHGFEAYLLDPANGRRRRALAF